MRKKQRGDDSANLDELIEEITVDANDHDEQLWAFPKRSKMKSISPSTGSSSINP
jgi:hypothetical protein